MKRVGGSQRENAEICHGMRNEGEETGPKNEEEGRGKLRKRGGGSQSFLFCHGRGKKGKNKHIEMKKGGNTEKGEN